MKVLKKIRNNDNIVVLRADRGDAIVVMDRDDSNKKWKSILTRVVVVDSSIKTRA